ncbi:glycoside hydrolase family 15 protein [Cellulomonas oligotrophica]|uniref:GH15 family glucan-1,4-alpha-glucosidase n=1 Tax=Cellulomonas oligotrophica TaxID=931536 RepID=A0A7Y9JXA7_9CELL|nr:glycoside hydrolase family 15 protein [Cellulomonas oligotrophica]NYD85731.1 GH15 family glucan-1,4-alpha-glucosidase [Cellulomonas oligotrophica]GIG31262.1 glycoside hydrolase family 15 [Cellulomonas oligotrophica]
MSTPLEDYALLSDLRTGPLVSRDGSIDWLCLPRFDSAAVFCAVLGDEDDGRWKLSAVDGEVVERRYVPQTFVLETIWRTPTGTLRVTDLLPPGTGRADLVRRVECLDGSAQIQHDLRLRFDYARATPWVRVVEHAGSPALLSLAGPDGLLVTGPQLTWAGAEDEGGVRHDAAEQPGAFAGTDDGGEAGARAPRLTGTFRLEEGDVLDWDLTWFPSWSDLPDPVDVDQALAETLELWSGWSARVTVETDHAAVVLRSLLVLRALTHSETGGIVAAPTASLPEGIGGERNWDYRFVWLRDAALTIEVAVAHGLTEGARLWRDWLLRAVAGDADDEYSWGLQKSLLRYCEVNLERQDHGIWEMRGDVHYFTHGRAMMWAAFDRGVRAVEQHGLDGPVERWRELREVLREEIDSRGFSTEVDSFTQTYDGTDVDASLLQLPHTGYLDYDDPRMLSTVARIESELLDEHGLLHRYRTDTGIDGLEGEEHPFLICCFWLVEQHALSGRLDDAEALMDQLVGYANDLGLLSEEYDPGAGRLIGNFPQAFSHLGLIRAADAIAAARRA